MKIKRGDTVKIITGKDKGKTGQVVIAMPLINKVVVEGINVVVRHKKAQGKDKPAGRIKVPAPIHVSNVKLVSAATKAKAEKPVEAKTSKSKPKK
jgi:large subunit ribosomal protein L24